MFQQRRRWCGNHGDSKAYKHFQSPMRYCKQYFRVCLIYKKRSIRGSEMENRDVWNLFWAVLLHTAVDVAQSGSGQHVGRLLVDQRIKVSLDLKREGEESEERLRTDPVHCEPMVLLLNGESQRYWWWKLLEELLWCSINKRCAKNKGMEHQQQCMTHTLSWDSKLNLFSKRFQLWILMKEARMITVSFFFQWTIDLQITCL